MKKINRPEDLPEWFELESYHAARDFGPVEWLACLRIRQNIFGVLNSIQEVNLPLASVVRSKPALRVELDEIRRSPLNMEGCASWAEIAGDVSEGSPASPVRPMIWSDITRQYLEGHPPAIHFDSQRTCDSSNRGSPINCEEFYESGPVRWNLITKWPDIGEGMIDKPIDPGKKGCRTVLVDLRATDAVLKEAFDQWLKDARVSKRERLAYEKWSRFGLLPYLDLFIWGKETENQPTRHLMSQAVGYASGGDSFQKTVPSLAKRLMEDLGELEAIAATDSKTELLKR